MKEIDERLLCEAIKYVENGFHIFPCRNKNEGIIINKEGKELHLLPKQPLIKGGVHASSNNIEQVKKWWSGKYKGKMIGCNLNRSNRFVVDIDNHKVNGFDAWHKLQIDDDGCNHVMTPNGGLHVYFSGHGRSSTSKKTGIDTRGDGTLTILPSSYLVRDDDTIGRYICMDDMLIEPRPVTEDVFEKLGLIRKEKIYNGSPHIVPMSLVEEFNTVKEILYKLPYEVIDNYDDWVRVAAYLHKFEDSGKALWCDWTIQTYLSVNPNSKRKDLDYKWDSFREDRREITFGTIVHFAKKYGIVWKKELEKK